MAFARALSPSFPDPVNEVAARVVAAGVVLLTALALALQVRWLAPVLAGGFLLRVLWGPRVDPLGRLATRVVVPRLAIAPRPVPGPPKRFAQAVGLLFSATATGLLYSGLASAGWGVLAALLVAALLESGFGLCLGCRAFALLMRAGVIPPEVCERCADITDSRPVVGARP